MTSDDGFKMTNATDDLPQMSMLTIDLPSTGDSTVLERYSEGRERFAADEHLGH